MPDHDDQWAAEQADERIESLKHGFAELSAGWSHADRAEASLNEELLRWACEGYFRDLAHRKNFHDLKVADRHKRASYTVKWLLHFRPIQYRSYYISMRLALANEVFALLAGLRHLNVPMDLLPPSLFEHIIYYFRHEPYDANAWGIVFYLIDQSATSGIWSK